MAATGIGFNVALRKVPTFARAREDWKPLDRFAFKLGEDKQSLRKKITDFRSTCDEIREAGADRRTVLQKIT